MSDHAVEDAAVASDAGPMRAGERYPSALMISALLTGFLAVWAAVIFALAWIV